MTMRIDAQLDEEYARKLTYIEQRTQQPIAVIIKNAIDLYYQHLQQQKPLDVLRQTGFIGCGQADSNLSVNYKSILKDGL